MSARPLVVLKFGSSVLRDPAALDVAVHEIYRFVRGGRRVLAVVSAFGRTTDHLIALVEGVNEAATPALRAEVLASGERLASAALCLALDAAGVPAEHLDERGLGLLTEGEPLEATPVALDEAAVHRAFQRAAVLVVPGFLGVGADGRTSLLGRGGSDLSAVYLAHRLGAERCRLVKDVDGWFDGDPAAGPAPRFAALTFEDAAAREAPIVQARTVRYARGVERGFEVGAPGSRSPTRVGASATIREPAAEVAPAPPLRVALLGLGTVGLALLRRLRALPALFEPTGVLVRDAARPRPPDVDRALLCSSIDELLLRPCDAVVELVGGVEAAEGYVRRALELGCHVVTANKALLARRGVTLTEAAAARGRRLLDSAAVGGAVPMLEAVRTLAAGPGVRELRGVLNGTSGYVLDRLAEGSTLEAALAAARARGLAEADPTQDVDGHDAAQKLALLVRAAFGAELAPEALEPESIRAARPARGRMLRLVARARRTKEGGVEAAVRLETLAPGDALARCAGERCGLEVIDGRGGRRVLLGRGAGGRPTAEAVLADLFDLQDEALRERSGSSVREASPAFAAGGEEWVR